MRMTIASQLLIPSACGPKVIPHRRSGAFGLVVRWSLCRVGFLGPVYVGRNFGLQFPQQLAREGIVDLLPVFRLGAANQISLGGLQVAAVLEKHSDKIRE